MLFATLAVLASTWAVTDTTDNNTGQREISTYQSSFNDVERGISAYLFMTCTSGKVSLRLDWPSQYNTKFVPIVTTWNFAPAPATLGKPEIWETAQDSARAPNDFVERLVSELPENRPFSLTIYRQSGDVTAYFLSEGLPAAYKRVAANCK